MPPEHFRQLPLKLSLANPEHGMPVNGKVALLKKEFTGLFDNFDNEVLNG